MTISAVGQACLEIIDMQMGRAGSATRVEDIDRENLVAVDVTTEMQFNK